MAWPLSQIKSTLGNWSNGAPNAASPLNAAWNRHAHDGHAELRRRHSPAAPVGLDLLGVSTSNIVQVRGQMRASKISFNRPDCSRLRA